MAKIKSLEQISKKWSEVTPQRQEQYAEGVQGAGKDWEKNTVASQSTYDAAIQRSIQEKSFSRGVRAAGGDRWEAKTLEKGPLRWAQGVAVSTEDYAKGFAPYRQVIANLQLPKRGPTGDPNNIRRVAAVAAALHAAKSQRGR